MSLLGESVSSNNRNKHEMKTKGSDHRSYSNAYRKNALHNDLVGKGWLVEMMLFGFEGC